MTYPLVPEPEPLPEPLGPGYAPAAQVPVGTRIVTVETARTSAAGLYTLRARPRKVYLIVANRGGWINQGPVTSFRKEGRNERFASHKRNESIEGLKECL